MRFMSLKLIVRDLVALFRRSRKQNIFDRIIELFFTVKSLKEIQ